HPPHISQRTAHWRGADAAWLAATTDANVTTLFGIAF
ncbi:hydrolase TatD, partial [Escherichia coli]